MSSLSRLLEQHPTETLLITSPLEPEHVARLRAVAPGQLRVLHEPDLIATPRFPNDHVGTPVTLTLEQEARWRSVLAEATILFNFPRLRADRTSWMADASNVRWVQTSGTGIGQLVRAQGLAGRDILVTTARGVQSGPLAEFVMLALLVWWRDLDRLRAGQRAKRWAQAPASEVSGRLILTIGAGESARSLAERARPFGLRIEAVTRRPALPRAHAGLFDALHPPSGLTAALDRADAVVVMLPHTPMTAHLIDAAAFTAMKPGVAFVNVGRGQTVDEAALIAALRDGRVGFAALDVANPEPMPPSNPLWDMPNVLISPHSASITLRGNQRVTDLFCDNLRAYVQGRRGDMRNVLDQAQMY